MTGKISSGKIGECTDAGADTAVQLFTPSASLPVASRKKAFTLIELLVALTLLGILGGSIAGVLRNATESVNHGNETLENITRLRSLEVVLGTALRDLLPVEVSSEERRMMAQDGRYDPADGRYRFCGEEQRLSFCLSHPFLSLDRDGYTHWVTLEILYDEDTGRSSLWLTDEAFLQGVDNPVGEDWGELSTMAEQWLPTTELCLLKDADNLIFRYWRMEQSGYTDEPEPEEVEAEDIDGDYARYLPDYVELEITMPRMETESLYMDVSIRKRTF